MNSKKLLIHGDIHLSSKNYGSHINYPKESLDCYETITEALKSEDCGILVGLGDLTYGRFHDLDYRLKVENLFNRQNELTNGEKYELKGNHDKMTTGKSEWEFYYEKGVFKNPDYLDVGCVRFHFVNHGEEGRDLQIDKTRQNVVFAHNFFKYSNNLTPIYGEGIHLDRFAKWKDVDFIICGHIHDVMKLGGFIISGENGEERKEIPVYYLGSLPRPSYKKEGLDTIGNLMTIDCSGTEMKIEIIELELPPIEEVFMVANLEKDDTSKEPKIDVSDIVKELAEHNRIVGDPEAIIDRLNVFSLDVRNKAKELYRSAIE